MDPSYDLLFYTYRDPQAAVQALEHLRKLLKKEQIEVVTAAAVSKDAAGESEITGALDLNRKRGTRRGALAGGLLTLLVPPLGIAAVAAGAVAGGAIGRKVGSEQGEAFAQEFLERVQKQIGANSSALVVLAESSQADRLAASPIEPPGELIRQPLPAEAVEALLHEGQQMQDTPGVSEEEIALLRSRVQAATRRKGPHFERVFVIINPASGKDATILNTLNTVFHAGGLDWDIAITKKAGDATRLARQAADDGYDVVAAYGGDGTVMEAATGLANTGVPLAILPGGTNNVMSVELGVPKDLFEAASLIGAAPAEIRDVDMGRANEHDFILRVGVGYEAVINETADRAMKDRFGGFAYSMAGLKALKDPPIARYTLTMDDGRVEELEGLWCMVANSASLGAPNLDLVQDISVSDGLLDVIIVRHADLDSLVSVISSVTGREKLGQPLPHWQVRSVHVEADPAQAVTGDGEIWENTPLRIEVIPGAVKILTPVAA